MSALKDADMSKQVLVFHCMDNGSFFSMDRSGGSSLPKKISNVYHIIGRLVVAFGYALELMVEQIAHIVKEGKVGTAVVITPMSRYLDPCCAEHNEGKTEEMLEEERAKLLKAVWNLKREVFQLFANLHCKNITAVSPMEVLGVKDLAEGARNVMSDGVHLRDALDKVVDHVIQDVEELFVKKKQGPTERAGPVGKKPRLSSSSFFDGGVGRARRRGRGVPMRQHYSYSSY